MSATPAGPVAPVRDRTGFVPSSQPVLLVDDEPADAATSEAALSAGGYHVAAESRGDAVLRLVRTLYIRIVVAELYVPCAEGPCVATVLGGERRRFPRLRVIVNTRHAGADDAAWAAQCGADVVLRKPTPAALLLAQVDSLDESGNFPGWSRLADRLRS